MKNSAQIFIQDWGTHSDQTLVVVGLAKNKVIKYCKREKLKKDFVKWIENDVDWNFLKSKSGAFFYCDDVPGTLLYLREYADSWSFWETLIHELHHAVHEWGKRKCENKEMEMLAYQQEYLFRSIRRKLQEIK